MDFQFDEKRSLEILIDVLKQSGLEFRMKGPDEEGGFFYIENGERKKFTENIFIKRSIKVEQQAQKYVSIDEICNNNDECENIDMEMSDNLNTILKTPNVKDEMYKQVEFVDLNTNDHILSDFDLSSLNDVA